MHVKFWCWKNISSLNDSVFYLFYENGTESIIVNSAYFMKSAPYTFSWIFPKHCLYVTDILKMCTWKIDGENSGPSCSKLTTSLVNDSLKFTLSDTQICWNFLLKKMWVAFAVQKLLTFFQQKISDYCVLIHKNIVYLKTVNEMTLNDLVKLTTLWTTGPCFW